MAMTPEELERHLRDDLRRLGKRLDGEGFCRELYQTLANHQWRHPIFQEDVHVAPSWKRIEEIINELRVERGEQPMVLAQTGGEGTESEWVLEHLERLEWQGTLLDTSEHDDEHVESPQDAPRTLPSDRFATAHEEAEQERKRRIRT
jgi:hypothetical protein